MATDKMVRCDRRAFLLGAGASALASGCATTGGGFDRGGGETVRFCVFADIHYSPGYWPHGNREWLDRILNRAVQEQVDFVIHLGDMSLNPMKERAYVEYYNDFKPVKTYHILGNHEFENGTLEDVAPLYRIPKGYYHFDCRGYRFIALDPHYHVKDGSCVHFARRCSYPKEAVRFIVPPEQMAWLKATIADSPHPCVVMAHEHFEDARGGIHNHAAIRQVLNDANAKCPGKVRLVINGHEHKDHFRVLDGIPYFSLNSASYDTDRKHTAYPAEFVKKCASAEWLLTWNDPLSAIITMTGDGGLSIDGARSSFYLGVTPEMAGWAPHDGRWTVPCVQSLDLKFNYAKQTIN